MNKSSCRSPTMRLIKHFGLLLIATSLSSELARCQFLPQSHLGRLVQSFTSPIVLQSSSSADPSDSSDSYADSPYYSAGGDSADQADQGPTQYQQQHQQQTRPAATRQQYSAANQEQALQSARLQQAPSQQRGVPQQFYGSGLDEDGQDQVGSAPSNSKHTQEYQMGADLGPTIDDKEMQGVFNSNNDERDDDDGAGYEPSQTGRSRAASNSAYSPSSSLGEAASSRYRNPNQDDDSADEEDESPRANRAGQSGRRQARRGGYLNQAASQFRQRPSSAGQDGSSSMLAAANGYAPYGYANGPVDLSSMMAGMGGPAGFGPNQMFQGDGSYPGANYYQQQQASGQRQRGARNQAESAADGYYNNGYAGRQPSSEGSANQRDRDEGESEADDDRRKA